MILFNYFINLIEGLILSSFIACYFDLKNKLKYIFMMTLICFLQISISNYINQFDQLLIYFLMLTLLISLWKIKKTINFEDIIICFIAGMILLIGNLMALTCTSVFFSVTTDTIYNNTSLLIFSIIMSKIIFCFIAILICIFKKKTSINLSLRNWWIISILGLSIIFEMAILTEILLVDIITPRMIVVLMLAVIIISLIFVIVFRKIQIENSEKIKFSLEVQKNKFKEENYNKINVMSNQIIDAEHRMMYVLIQIKNCINNGDYDGAKLLTDQYINKVKKFDVLINTNNPYLDFVLSRKINEYAFENIIIKNTIFIFENEMYDNKYFCDLIILILDTFKKHLDNKKEISLDIDQENDFIIVKVTGKLCIKELEINNEIQRLIDILDADYSLSKINDIFTLKFIVTLK